MNVVVLRGHLSRPVSLRALPSGDLMAVLDLTVPGGGDPHGRAASVPLAWFDPPGWASDLEEGSEMVVVGRVRRRFFRSGPALQSRTEVVVEAGALAHRTARAASVVARAIAELSTDPGSEDPPSTARPPRASRRRAPATFP